MGEYEIWNQIWTGNKMLEINYDFVKCDNGILGMLRNTHLGDANWHIYD